VSPKTVEKHRASLMHKLGLVNAAEITLVALEMGLIERPMPLARLAHTQGGQLGCADSPATEHGGGGLDPAALAHDLQADGVPLRGSASLHAWTTGMDLAAAG
jgi:hypothetical protein